MVKFSRHFQKLLCAMLLAAATGSAGAQSASGYPNKPVRIILPAGQGGPLTITAQVLGERISRDLGQNFLADFRPGANGVIGARAAATAPPDGYTLYMNSSAHVTLPLMNPDLTFDPLKDLVPVTMLVKTNFVLALSASAPGTLKEFIAHTRANPDKLNLGYTSPLGLLNQLMFMSVANMKYQPIAYKSGPETVTAMLAGDTIGSLTTAPNVLALINAGKLKAVAVTGDKRMRALPNVPTFAEAGLPQFNISNWFALWAPAKTPRDIVQKLNMQFRKVQEMPEVASILEDKANVEVFTSTPDEAEKFVLNAAAQYAKTVKDSGVKLDN